MFLSMNIQYKLGWAIQYMYTHKHNSSIYIRKAT